MRFNLEQFKQFYKEIKSQEQELRNNDLIILLSDTIDEYKQAIYNIVFVENNIVSKLSEQYGVDLADDLHTYEDYQESIITERVNKFNERKGLLHINDLCTNYTDTNCNEKFNEHCRCNGYTNSKCNDYCFDCHACAHCKEMRYGDYDKILDLPDLNKLKEIKNNRKPKKNKLTAMEHLFKEIYKDREVILDVYYQIQEKYIKGFYYYKCDENGYYYLEFAQEKHYPAYRKDAVHVIVTTLYPIADDIYFKFIDTIIAAAEYEQFEFTSRFKNF